MKYTDYKHGTRVKFKDNAYAVAYNSEVNLANITGTVKQNDYLDAELVARYNNGKIYNLAIWVEMDKHLEDFDEWNNEVMFTSSGDGGTDLDYLTEFSSIIKE